MALMTVTNLQATAMNAVDSNSAGATGGARKDPLPHPFQHIVLSATGGGSDAKQLPVHQADFRHKSVPWLSMEPREEWNMLVQAGKVTVAFAAQTGQRDVEDAGDGTY